MKRFGLAALLAVLAPLPALAQDAPRKPPTEEEARALFEWFDGLGFPDVRGKPWVRVTTEYEGDDRRHDSYGFLISEGKESFRVLHPIPVEIEYHRRGTKRFQPDRVSFERADLLGTLKPIVLGREGLPEPGARENVPDLPGGFAFMGWKCRVGFFVVARAAWAAGEREWALRLLACYDRERWRDRDDPTLSLRGLLEEDLAEGRFGECLEDHQVGFFLFEEERDLRPRGDLLAACLRIAGQFPASTVAPNARAMAKVLQRMVDEDAKHAVPEGFPDRCPPEARAREWVFRLRDQGGHCFCLTHGPPSVLVKPMDSPANRLESLGHAAVPALLGALDDDRLTRAADHEGRLAPQRLLTVGEAAMQILRSVAGRHFGTREEAEAWWTSVRTLGAERYLVEAVRRFDRDSGTQAGILARMFPGSALEPIVEAARRCPEGWWIHRQLVEAAGGLPGDGPVPFLLETLAEGISLDGRVAAAEALRARGRPEALPAMIREWKEPRGWRHHPWGLIAFLLEAGDPAGVRALGDGLADRKPDLRYEVARRAWEAAEERREGTVPTEEYRRAVQDLLAGLLADRSPLPDSSQWICGVDLTGRRNCDLAGAGLARMMGVPGALDPQAKPEERDRQLAAIAEMWRKGRSR